MGAAAGDSAVSGASPEAPAPSIEEGTIDPGAEARSATLMAEAREALADGEYVRARDAAQRIVTEFPRASGSVEALILLAEASFALREYDQAQEAAGRYAGIFTPEHGRWGQAILLQAGAFVGLDRPAHAFEVLLEHEAAFPAQQTEEALELIRANVSGIETERLTALIESSGEGSVLFLPILAEYAVSLYFMGDQEREDARRLAEEVRRMAPGSPEARIAGAILGGDPEGILGSSATFAALLPSSGSPALTEFGELIEEGVRLAVEMDSRQHRVPVVLQVADDEGRPERGAQVARQLEQQGVFGFIGPLLDPSVDAVARGRQGSAPIISPTARMLPQDIDGVYSLSSVDPAAALLLADYAGQAGFQRVAVVFPGTAEAREEARIFGDAYRRNSASGTILEIPYTPGQTSFSETMLEVETFEADALVLPLGPDDIELLAPQIAFFGVDTLGVQVMGTSAWALDDVLGAIATRHTDNVIVATARHPDGVRPSYATFTEEYEQFFQKSLVSRVPALGYDAAALLIEAFRRSGARNPAELRQALENIRDFPGTTGRLSVIDGRIVREHILVRLDNRRLVPLAPTFE